MVRLVVISLSLFVVIAGCTTASDSTGGLTGIGAAFSCADPIDAFDDVPDDFNVVSGVVAFPPQDFVLQRGRTGPDNDLDSSRAFSKFGLLVRSGATFEIHVDGESQANALIHWGNTGPNDPVSSLSVDRCTEQCNPSTQPSCPDGEDLDWFVFPGGLWTLESACVRLVVLTETERSIVDLSAGTACK